MTISARPKLAFPKIYRGYKKIPLLCLRLAGFSDVYRTQHGYVGGWILKNSWWARLS